MNLDDTRYVHITGAVNAAGQGMVVCIEEEYAEERVQHAHLIEWDTKQWRYRTRVDWAAVSVCDTDFGWVVLGPRGQALALTPGSATQESVDTPEEGPATTGLMSRVRNIDGGVYAVGMRRQLYLRHATGVWERQDEGLRRTSAAEGVVGLQSIDGFARDDLYAVGWKGEIWRGRPSHWERIASPTNFVLADVCCAPDGQVYAVGQRGTLLRGRESRWEQLEFEGPKEDFWGAAWYGDRLLLSSLRSVYAYDGRELQRLDMGEIGLPSCYHLSSRGAWLWSVGLRSISAFDGTTWTELSA
ncbi:hypothetical protein [Caldimonas brevitalea]|uniref:Uncharacterized protein n=1 Tax=Caldimonas brevitalea TaxID=413882 RepID=A0A0G3BT35_9BURK|nr:hypothetical protein [Caldimonas brevitalea]AKJ29690.1 hypothetical protein AAW51_2999 [Caldimonas brevitalea]